MWGEGENYMDENQSIFESQIDDYKTNYYNKNYVNSQIILFLFLFDLFVTIFRNF